jgi:hypothetical protein
MPQQKEQGGENTMTKLCRVIGDEALGLFLISYRGKLASVGRSHTVPVKTTALRRKKRHLKKLYRIDGYYTYSAYMIKSYEIVLILIGSDRHSPPIGGHYTHYTAIL